MSALNSKALISGYYPQKKETRFFIMIGKVIYYKLRLWNEEALVPHYTTQAAQESQRWNYIYNNSILDDFEHHARREHWLKLEHLYKQYPTEDMETLIEYLPLAMEDN